jgi:hypothetical protein
MGDKNPKKQLKKKKTVEKVIAPVAAKVEYIPVKKPKK